MEIQARFAHTKLNNSQDNETFLVLTLTAPKIDWLEKRPDISVLPVIDVSGSMTGPKLEYAQKSALKLVEHLKPGDVSGLVVFSNGVNVLVPPGPVTAEQKDRLRNAISKLKASGGTNFAEAMSRSLELVQNLDLPPKYNPRVIMFTDGEPTVGITDNNAILRILAESRAQVTVSAFGYGAGGVWGGCDQDFLTAFAKQGAGNYAYIKEPDAALSAFGKELGGLLSTYATDLSVDVEPLAGHRVVEVVSDVDAHETDVTGLLEVTLPDILAEEARHIVLKVQTKAGKAGPRAVNLFDVEASYLVITEEGKKVEQKVSTKAKLRFHSGDNEKNPDKVLSEVIGLAQLVQAQLKAEEKANDGDYTGAAGVMQNAHQLEYISENSGLSALAGNIQDRVASSQMYASSAGYRRSTHMAGTRAYGVVGMDAGASADLAGSTCFMSFDNEARGALADSFQADSGVKVEGLGTIHKTSSGKRW
jgi:Ca-activated chloride channel family protein